MAYPLADCGGGRNAEVRLRACSEVIASSAFSPDDKADAAQEVSYARKVWAACQNVLGTVRPRGTAKRRRSSSLPTRLESQSELTVWPRTTHTTMPRGKRHDDLIAYILTLKHRK
jgi:hypothetical protein